MMTGDCDHGLVDGVVVMGSLSAWQYSGGVAVLMAYSVQPISGVGDVPYTASTNVSSSVSPVA